MVPGFHCSFLPGMPSSPTPGSPTSICSRTSMPTWPSPYDHRLGTPNSPAIRSTRASHFVASLVRFRYGLPGCSPPCTDRTGTPQPSGTFTSRLSTDRSPSPSLDITTTVTGLLCWRDSHPLEWQLASLHGHEQTNRPRQCRVCLCSLNRLRNPAKLLPRSSTRPHLRRAVLSGEARSLRIADGRGRVACSGRRPDGQDGMLLTWSRLRTSLALAPRCCHPRSDTRR